MSSSGSSSIWWLVLEDECITNALTGPINQWIIYQCSHVFITENFEAININQWDVYCNHVYLLTSCYQWTMVIMDRTHEFIILLFTVCFCIDKRYDDRWQMTGQALGYHVCCPLIWIQGFETVFLKHWDRGAPCQYKFDTNKMSFFI